MTRPADAPALFPALPSGAAVPVVRLDDLPGGPAARHPPPTSMCSN
jgi:hypothetical protein